MREMPHSIETERALLGSLLVFDDGMKIAADQGLNYNDFYLETNQRIYSCMLDLYFANMAVDINTLTTKLSEKNQLVFVGNVEYLFQLTQSAVSSANIKYYIEIVQEKSHTRRLINAAQAVLEKGYEKDVDLDDTLSDAEKLILEVTRSRRTADFQKGSEVINRVIQKIEDLSKGASRITGLKTDYIDFDRITNGLQNGDLLILAARPSVGKTAFALNLARKCAKVNDAVVGVFSLEMPAEQLVSRMLSSESGVNMNLLKTGRLDNDQWCQLSQGANQLKMCKIYIDDSSTIKINEIFAKCRKLKADEGQLDLIIIDYLQLISGRSGSSESRQQEVSEISRSLKQLARDINCPVIALSQLSRNVENRTDKTPQLSDLRESGSIEQDADIVMFLSREDYQKTETENSDIGEVQVIFAKHRNGSIGRINLTFNKACSCFYNSEFKPDM